MDFDNFEMLESILDLIHECLKTVFIPIIISLIPIFVKKCINSPNDKIIESRAECIKTLDKFYAMIFTHGPWNIWIRTSDGKCDGLTMNELGYIWAEMNDLKTKIYNAWGKIEQEELSEIIELFEIVSKRRRKEFFKYFYYPDENEVKKDDGNCAILQLTIDLHNLLNSELASITFFNTYTLQNVKYTKFKKSTKKLIEKKIHEDVSKAIHGWFD